MLGDQLGESKGKRIARRVLSSEPLRIEVSFEDAGTMLGVVPMEWELTRRRADPMAQCMAKVRER